MNTKNSQNETPAQIIYNRLIKKGYITDVELTGVTAFHFQGGDRIDISKIDREQIWQFKQAIVGTDQEAWCRAIGKLKEGELNSALNYLYEQKDHQKANFCLLYHAKKEKLDMASAEAFLPPLLFAYSKGLELTLNVDLNQQDGDDRWPLEYAAKNGHTHLFASAKRHGFSFSKEQCESLIRAGGAHYASKILVALREIGVESCFDLEELIQKVESAKQWTLFNHLVYFQHYGKVCTGTNLQPIHFAVKHGLTKALDRLDQIDPKMIDEIDPSGLTPIDQEINAAKFASIFPLLDRYKIAVEDDNWGKKILNKIVTSLLATTEKLQWIKMLTERIKEGDPKHLRFTFLEMVFKLKKEKPEQIPDFADVVFALDVDAMNKDGRTIIDLYENSESYKPLIEVLLKRIK